MTKKGWSFAIGIMVPGIFLALSLFAQQTAPAAGSAGADVKVTPQVRDMAKNPTPPADAKKAGSVGSDTGTMNTKNSATDDDSVWVQEVDVDGDGNVEATTLLWDDEDKVLFISYKDDFACKKGGTGSGAVLIGLNGTGNPRNAPVGSGFYAVSMDKGECNSQRAGLYGCKFDENGVETACGVAVLDPKTDSLIIATATQ
jgi:hypothetical protein